jgi:hypothetical protein
MNLNKQDIHTMEQVGVYKTDPIYHIRTKGGLNIMALKKASGELRVLGQAAHRAVAKGMADKVQNGISWHENLYKSTDRQFNPQWGNVSSIQHDAELRSMPHASTPENHKKIANWHAHFSNFHKDNYDQGKDINNHLAGEYHKNEAIKHYQMAGMNPQQAHEAFGAQHMYNKEQGPDGKVYFNEPQPFHGSKLEDDYRMKNKNVPKGHLPGNFWE